MDAAESTKPLVSVVIPCYYSEQVIDRVVDLTAAALTELGHPFEFILVNDGSTDGTFDRIRELAQGPFAITGVNLARNFGQHAAIMCGLRHANGDLVLVMDDDLQTHPSQIGLLLEEACQGWDVVFAAYGDLREAWWRRLGSGFTVWTMRALTGRPRGIEVSNFFVMRRFVAEELTRYEGPFVYIQGLLFKATHHMANVSVQHFDREVGRSGYTLKSLIALWSTVLNFSMVPLRLASILGAGVGGVGFVGAIVLAIRRLLDPSLQLGWSSLMVTILICAGCILLCLGVMGEYLGRLFMTVNRSPQYVERESVLADGVTETLNERRQS
ncbi:glycosyltransferase family 2 protein [Collinsella sp. AGMB00827]|uniref:Glycosyltransferase family 2 protein n=1 Tax=Collinsella ureilytica TaxID=2869515 RepID=A0ABS7MI14_9ACTN|nr:glycosyltransferase family 2 protein [Collinsella urealyticum]MBY4796996.1 glycosyltransferase family 2 protein [Collinsella urealyticum]